MPVKKAFPNVFVCKKGDWEIHIKFKGIFNRFIMNIAQLGDPFGKVTLEGPGIRISISKEGDMLFACPINLCRGNKILDLIKDELLNKYNKKLDEAFLRGLLKEALKPYGGWV